MSAVEKRQTQQRAISIAACAAAFAVGGPLIGYRFEIQKTGEAYKGSVAELGAELAMSRVDEAPPEGANEPWLKTVSYGFQNSFKGNLQNASYQAGRGDLSGLSAGAADNQSLMHLAVFGASQVDLAEREQSEVNCLAEAVYYEARSESTEGQMAVAEVVMNRVHDSRFPKSVCAVVYQGRYRDTGCQFTFTCDGSLRSKPYGIAWDRAKAVALHVRMGLSKPVTNRATHYHTDYVNPYWSAGLIETAEVGTHVFYRFPKGPAEWGKVRLALDAQEQRNATVQTYSAEPLAVSADGLTDGQSASQPVLSPISASAPPVQAEAASPL